MTDSGDLTSDLTSASIQELEAGRLPLRAQQRLAMMRADQAFTSDLTPAEHHAVRSVGFSPVGQVMGSCVYQIAYGMWNCGTWQTSVLGGFGGAYISRVVAADALRQVLEGAQRRAIDRMQQEAAGLSADGIVAVHLETSPFPAGGTEVWALGTAVRADGDRHARTPFTCDLSGQDFAKLLLAGWLPCALALGISVMVRHDDVRTTLQRRSWSNVELDGYSELVHAARAGSRAALQQDVARHGANHVVQRDIEIHIGEQPCRFGGTESHDHIAEAVVIGTALAPLSTTPTPPRVTATLPLIDRGTP